MAFTLTQLAALEAAYASGEQVVQYDGKRVEYRSIKDLEIALNRVRGALTESGQLPNPIAASNARGGFTYVEFCRHD